MCTCPLAWDKPQLSFFVPSYARVYLVPIEDNKLYVTCGWLMCLLFTGGCIRTYDIVLTLLIVVTTLNVCMYVYTYIYNIRIYMHTFIYMYPDW